MAKKKIDDGKIKDLTGAQQGKGVEVIVRPNNSFGGAQAGEHILIDEDELENTSVMSACMTIAEEKEIAKERDRRIAAAEEKKLIGNPVKRAVEAGIAQMEANIAAIAAKKKAMEDTFESEKLKKIADAREIAE